LFINFAEKIFKINIMLGAITGDIIGSRFEFKNHLNTDFELFTAECTFTDDTVCTVAVADALLKGFSFEKSLQFWCRKYPNPKGAYGGSFAAWLRSENPAPYNSFGNGSTMRVSPVAWVFDNRKEV
jgi:ADP-ribosylglycohydrolase